MLPNKRSKEVNATSSATIKLYRRRSTGNFRDGKVFNWWRILVVPNSIEIAYPQRGGNGDEA
eukprot:4275635-Amphidinium_carterae.1